MKIIAIRRDHGASPATPTMPWRASRLLSAPHRLSFFAAALMLAASALWWLAMLLARQAGLATPWAVPPLLAHSLLMALGFMPLFITGFLFTAGPRWLLLPEVPARQLLLPVSVILTGWPVAVAGFHRSAPLAAAGLALGAAGWTLLVARAIGLVRASRVDDKLHAGGTAVAGAFGALAWWLAAVALAVDAPAIARAAVQLAIWGFLAPTFTIVSHRMLPFFTASTLPAIPMWRPQALLWGLVAVLGFSGAMAVAETLWWPLPAALRWLQFAVEAPAALLLLVLAWRWGFVQSWSNRLLAMLHGGFIWLGVAMALAAVSHLRVALGGDEASLGLAPVHALTLGYLGATLVAMATRVVSGHSGRPLVADGIAWSLYLLVQAAAVLRVASALDANATLTLAAMIAWAMATTGWAWRYGRWLGRPRVDGRPG